MGARPSQFKKSGGFLNGVDATWTDYQLTDEFNGQPYVAGKIKAANGQLMERPHALNALLSFRLDGADEDTTVTLKVAGNYDDWVISEDGHSISRADGGEANLSQNSGMAKFIASLCKPIAGGPGFPEDQFSDDPDSIDFSPALGTRLRLEQQVDLDRTKKFGKRKGKDGREFDRQDLVVAEVYEVPGAPVTTSAKGSAKSKANGTSSDPVADLAALAIQEMLSRNGGAFKKAKINALVLNTPLLKGHPQRDAVRVYLTKPENLTTLATSGVIGSFDGETIRAEETVSA